MVAVTGPVMSSPSACRGEATYWMPKRPRSKTGVESTFTSDSQPLHPPALTTRSFSDRPNSCRNFSSRAAARGYSWGPRSTRPSRIREARRYSVVKAMAPSGHACTHSGQKRQRPRSSRKPASGCSALRAPPVAGKARSSGLEMAPVGQASTQARQPSAQREGSSTGSPRKRSGSVGGSPGNADVRCPCCTRASRTFSMPTSQVVPAVGEVEALVAEREVGDLLVAQRQREAGPVVEGGIDDLVGREAALTVGDAHVADLAAPALDERNAEEVGPGRPAAHARGALRQLAQLLAKEGHRALDLQPADVRARVHVAPVRGGDGDVREAGHPR